MRLQLDADSPTPVRRALTEQLDRVIEGGARRARALSSSRELAGFLDPNTVTRAIKELKRSGCRPLHSRPEAPEPSSIQAAATATARPARDGDGA